MTRSLLVAVDKMGSDLLLMDFSDSPPRKLPLPLSPHEMLLSQDGKRVWASIYGSGTFRKNPAPGQEIVEVDVQSWTINRSLSIAPYTSPHGLTMDAFGTLWTSCDPHGVVLALSPDSGALLAVVETGSLGTHWVVAPPDGRKLFSSNKDDLFLSVIDPQERRMTGRIPVPHGTEGMNFSPDGRWLFAADHRRPHVLRIDVQDEKLVDTIVLRDLPFDDSRDSHHMRLRCSPDGTMLAVAAYHFDRLVIIDSADTSRQTALQTGSGPMALAFDPQQPHHLYLSNHDEGTVSLFDLQIMRLVRTFPCGEGIESMEFVEAG